MKTSITPHKTILALLSFALVAVPAMKAEDQEMSNTNAPQGTNSCQKGGWGKGHHHEGLEVLSEAEREEFKSDMKQIKDNPQLVAAHQAVKDASTPEAKQAAHKALKETRGQLLLQVDPKVQPILDKLEQAHKQHHHHHGGNGNGSPSPVATPAAN
jgi:cellobiose-specific phosphotransferase system component IIA